MHRSLLPVLLFCLLLLAACGSDDPPDKPSPPADDPQPAAAWTHQIGPMGASWYSDSPAQARPPDGQFANGTKLRIVSEHGSYVQVETEGGKTGYVATGAVVPIPAD